MPSYKLTLPCTRAEAELLQSEWRSVLDRHKGQPPCWKEFLAFGRMNDEDEVAPFHVFLCVS